MRPGTRGTEHRPFLSASDDAGAASPRVKAAFIHRGTQVSSLPASKGSSCAMLSQKSILPKWAPAFAARTKHLASPQNFIPGVLRRGLDVQRTICASAAQIMQPLVMGEALSDGFGHVGERNPLLTQPVQCAITLLLLNEGYFSQGRPTTQKIIGFLSFII